MAKIFTNKSGYFFRRIKNESSREDMIIPRIIVRPYAASILEDSLKKRTINTQPAQSNQLMEVMYICPFNSVGYLIFTFGQKLRRVASFISVNEPLMRAWEATTVATVAIPIPIG